MIAAVLLLLAASLDAAPPTRMATLDGRRIDPFAGDARATVFVFMHPDCPVSRKYIPELNRLHDEYVARGVRLFVVYPGGAQDDEALRAHGAEYAVRPTALRDPDYRLADFAGATMTPEAAVFVRGSLVYRGRIDDRAPQLGVWRPTASSRDLQGVLERLTRGERPAFSSTQVVGCFIKPLS